MIKPTFI